MNRLILAAVLACAFTAAAAPRAVAESTAAETKDEYVKKARAEIDELGRKIDDLAVQVKQAGASGSAELKRKVADLKSRRKASKKGLAKLKRASGQAWADLKAGVDKGIADIKAELDEGDKH